MKDDVHLNYQGDGATNYDAGRVSTDRHRRESEAVESQVALLSPRSILDCPFGTGRWLPYYANAERVVGIDRSSDMLQQARKKDAQGSLPELVLREGNIFDEKLFDPLALGTFDVVVCIRFLNWISLEDGRVAIRNLSRVAGSSILVGLTVRPEEWIWPARQKARLSTFQRNLRGGMRKKPRTFVHDETKAMGILAEFGWHRTERRETMRQRDRVNFIYTMHR